MDYQLKVYRTEGGYGWHENKKEMDTERSYSGIMSAKLIVRFLGVFIVAVDRPRAKGIDLVGNLSRTLWLICFFSRVSLQPHAVIVF